jgi:hypothetical protein
MSIVVSGVNAVSPGGRIALAAYKVTRPDGTFAWTGTVYNGAYSGQPGANADGSARSVGADGVFAGIGSDDTAAYDVSVWGSPPLQLNGDGGVDTPDNTFSPGLPGNPTAVAEVATAAADASVVAAIAAAVSGQGPGTYAVAIDLNLYGSGGTTKLLPTVSYGHPAGSAPSVATGDWLEMAPYDPASSVPGGYLSVTWTSSNPSVASLSAGAVLGPADTNLAVTITTGTSGTATITVKVVSFASPPPGMVLSVGVTVP